MSINTPAPPQTAPSEVTSEPPQGFNQRKHSPWRYSRRKSAAALSWILKSYQPTPPLNKPDFSLLATCIAARSPAETKRAQDITAWKARSVITWQSPPTQTKEKQNIHK